MVLRVYLKVLLTVLFYVIEFLITLHYVMNYLKKLYEACVLVNNSLYRKLVSSLESKTAFDEITMVQFFIPDFNILICQLENFTFKVL